MSRTWVRGSRIRRCAHGHVRSAMERALRRHKADALGTGPTLARSRPERCWTSGLREIEQADSDARNIFVAAGRRMPWTCCAHGSAAAARSSSFGARPPAGAGSLRAQGLEPVPVGADLAVPAPKSSPVPRPLASCSRQAIAFAYLRPTFHDPTGVSFSADDRMRLIAAARACGVTLIEDDPYRPLHFRSPPLPSLVSLKR